MFLVQVFWNVILKALQPFKTSGTTHQMTEKPHLRRSAASATLLWKPQILRHTQIQAVYRSGITKIHYWKQYTIYMLTPSRGYCSSRWHSGHCFVLLCEHEYVISQRRPLGISSINGRKRYICIYVGVLYCYKNKSYIKITLLQWKSFISKRNWEGNTTIQPMQMKKS